MFERIKETLTILGRLIMVMIVFVPAVMLMIFGGIGVVIVSGIITTISTPCLIVESAAMYIKWLMTGRTWSDMVMIRYNCKMWSLVPWTVWFELVNGTIDKVL